MHPIEAAIEFLLTEHVRRGDAYSVAQAEKHLAAIAEYRAEMLPPDPDLPEPAAEPPKA